jgi:hypothetical protein
MRLSIVGSGVLLIVGCASTPADNTAATERACSVSDCFLERDIRGFEVIDKNTVVVYTGSQRCAFQVDLTGTFCDMTFAPEVYFRSRSDAIQTEGRPGDEIFGSNIGDRGLRVCANDLQIDVDGGAFTETRSATNPADPFGANQSANGQRVDRFGQARSQCQVSGVASLTDDQLVELYVARGLVPPPPPMGSGEIEVGEQEAAEPAAPAEESNTTPQAGSADATTATSAATANATN